MHVVATETCHAMGVHGALDKIVALHPVLVRGAVGKMRKGLLTGLMLFKFPKIFEVEAHLEAYRPIVVFSLNGIGQRLPLRVTLDAYVGGLNRIQAGGIRDVLSRRPLDMPATWPVTFLAADIPLSHRFGADVVVDRVAAIAERSGRTSHVIGRIKRSPPVGIGSDLIGAPDLMGNVPLGAQRIVIIASPGEIALLPFAAIHEGNASFVNVTSGSALLRSGMMASGCTRGSRMTFAMRVLVQRA